MADCRYGCRAVCWQLNTCHKAIQQRTIFKSACPGDTMMTSILNNSCWLRDNKLTDSLDINFALGVSLFQQATSACLSLCVRGCSQNAITIGMFRENLTEGAMPPTTRLVAVPTCGIHLPGERGNVRSSECLNLWGRIWSSLFRATTCSGKKRPTGSYLGGSRTQCLHRGSAILACACMNEIHS